MVKKITITGGKGGTGKTLIATNLATKFSQEGYRVLLIDCDVENPNSNILLGKPLDDENVEKKGVFIFKPEFDLDLCTKCGKCREGCYRHAILQFPEQFPSLMDQMCSGCEVCYRICPTNAINYGKREIGSQYFIPKINNNLDLIVGELNPSEAVSVLIVEEILNFAEKLNKENDYDIFIIDSAPGAHCDVEHSISVADVVLAITEPTPFGEHDLRRIFELIKLTNKKADIIINRSTLTDYIQPIYDLVEKYECELLGEIPLDNIVIENYAKGIPFIFDTRKFPAKQAFFQIFKRISQKLKMLKKV